MRTFADFWMSFFLAEDISQGKTGLESNPEGFRKDIVRKIQWPDNYAQRRGKYVSYINLEV
jgi:hypothetical protein